MQKYGKPSAEWFKAKRWFFDEDAALAAEAQRLAHLYSRQPRRTTCKVCEALLDGESIFTKYTVPYFLCSRCGHFNGGFEDSEEFCAALYNEEQSDLFSRMYDSESLAAYEERRDSIYQPKADFLLEGLRESGLDPLKLRYADFGAGSGYFVSALRKAGVESVTGYEVSGNQVKLGNEMIGDPGALVHLTLDEGEALLSNVDADVVSLVFTLEHARNPKGLFEAVRRNSRVKYLYIAVPMYSPCVLIELVFEQFAQRHLAGGHTHLFTLSSLDHLCAEFGIDRFAEWWFGSDMIDFYRLIWMALRGRDGALTDEWKRMMLPLVDDMQLAIDKKHLASEVHFVARLAT